VGEGVEYIYRLANDSDVFMNIADVERYWGAELANDVGVINQHSDAPAEGYIRWIMARIGEPKVVWLEDFPICLNDIITVIANAFLQCYILSHHPIDSSHAFANERFAPDYISAQEYIIQMMYTYREIFQNIIDDAAVGYSKNWNNVDSFRSGWGNMFRLVFTNIGFHDKEILRHKWSSIAASVKVLQNDRYCKRIQQHLYDSINLL
jgi:hypothetical protein